MPTSVGVCEESDFVELPNGDLLFMSRVQRYDANGNYVKQERMQTFARKDGDTFIAYPSTLMPWNAQGFPSLLRTQEGIILDLQFSSYGSHYSTDNGLTWHNLKVDANNYNGWLGDAPGPS